jgi:hypothetical protein
MKIASALSSLFLVSFLTVTAFAQSNEIPLPPPTGPGGGNPGTPQPPYNPPSQPSQPVPPPEYPPQQPGTPPPAYGETPYTLGAAQTVSNDSATFTFRPQFGLDRLHRLQIVATSRKVNVRSVTVVYANGMGSQQVVGLDGIIRDGDMSRMVYLTGTPVEQVIVEASSSAFWRKKGGFRVDVTALPNQQ